MLGFGYAYKILDGRIPAAGVLVLTGVVGVLLNGPVSLAFSIGMMTVLIGAEVAMGLIALLPILTIAAVLNVVISIILYKSLGSFWNKIT